MEAKTSVYFQAILQIVIISWLIASKSNLSIHIVYASKLRIIITQNLLQFTRIISVITNAAIVVGNRSLLM